MTGTARDVRIAADVGGTFTDLVMVREGTGALAIAKTRTTPQDMATGFIHGVDRLLAANGVAPSEVANVIFTTTAATNAVLELAGARIGLIVTKGFRYVLEIARANIPGRLTNELNYNRPERLVPVERIREVDERMLPSGDLRRPLDEDSARRAIEELLDQDVECIAVCLLHSYANPLHERRIKELIQEARPDVLVSISSEVVPEYREYERTVTTVLNAYVMPVMERAVRGVQLRLREAGLDPSLGVVRCDGGVMSAESVIQAPVNTVLSGPAGGVFGASHIARLAGFQNVISLDMGGTSTDVSLAAGGKARIRSDTMIGEYPVKIPIMDIVTIGAGGGSIAYVSSLGALHVGPRSAGSVPGPVCYGQGGTEVTVTDANLLLGRLPPRLAGGEITVSTEKAEAAMTALADRLGMDPVDLARGILTIVNEKMLGALRVISLQRGYDPRDFVLIPFGGAGPMHSGDLQRLLGIPTALIPPTPGVLSALGALVADVTWTFGQTWIQPADAFDLTEGNRILDDLAARARDWLNSEGVAEPDQQVSFSSGLRYAGQAYEVTVPAPAHLDASTLQAIVGQFHQEHRRLYGFEWAGQVPVEVVGLKVTGIGRVAKPGMTGWGITGSDPELAIIERRPVDFDGRFVETPCYDRGRLGSGSRFSGPAIVEQLDCTTVIHPNQLAEVDKFLNLIVREA